MTKWSLFLKQQNTSSDFSESFRCFTRHLSTCTLEAGSRKSRVLVLWVDALWLSSVSEGLCLLFRTLVFALLSLDRGSDTL